MKTLRRHTTRIGKRNQVTIPAAMLRQLGVGPGDAVEIIESDGEVTLSKADDPVERLYGLLWRPDLPVLEIDELEDLIHRSNDEAAAARYRRTFD